MTQPESWQDDFNNRFFNPSIPSPNELKQWVKSVISTELTKVREETEKEILEVVKQYKCGEHKKLLALLTSNKTI